MRIFVDMDGTLAKWNNVELEQLLEKGYYRNLKPNQDLLDDVNELINQGEDIYILSCYLTESKYALEEKKEWCREYLPELREDKYVFVPCGESKAKFFNERGLSPITNTDYLIDDYTENLFEWKKFGGIGVKYLNGINHTKGTWTGLRINEKSVFEKKTDLFSFVLGEKLKLNYNIDLIGIIKNDISDITGIYDYECVYKNGDYYNIKGYPFWADRALQYGCDCITKEISDKIRYQHPDFLNQEFIEIMQQYYERRYPTLCETMDFDYLLKYLEGNTLDDMEYTLYLWNKTECIKINEQTNELVFDVDEDNLSRINSDYISWYEGAISTKDLINEASLDSINDSCIRNNDEEVEEHDICDED